MPPAIVASTCTPENVLVALSKSSDTSCVPLPVTVPTVPPRKSNATCLVSGENAGVPALRFAGMPVTAMGVAPEAAGGNA